MTWTDDDGQLSVLLPASLVEVLWRSCGDSPSERKNRGVRFARLK